MSTQEREESLSDGITPGKPVRMYQSDGTFADFSTEDVVAKKLNSFKGWSCGAGVENICINFDGDVQSASCGLLDSSGKTGKYGNVFESFQLPQKWISCTQTFCSCGADLFIPKTKSDTDRTNLRLLNADGANLSKRSSAVNSPVALERTFATQYRQVFWELGRRCNYDCSYCHPYVHNNFEEHKTLEKLLFALEKIEHQFGKGSKISFAISGGEPTTNPAYLEFLEHLTDRGHRVSTHSNGSRQPEYYVDLINLSDLNISVHFEFYHRSKMLEVLSAVVKEIHLRKSALQSIGHLEVMLMTKPGNLEQAKAFETEVREIPFFPENATITLMPIRGHESIDQKEKRSGDILLESYKPDELGQLGNQVILAEKIPLQVSFDLLTQFDAIDDLDNPETRLEHFRKISAGAGR